MEQNKKRGGAREGAGRPKGSGNKITAQDLIDTANKVIGKPFVVSLFEGYQDAIVNGDKKVRVMYEKMIMDKVLADRHQVETTESEDTTEQKAEAFKEALSIMATMAGVKPKDSK